MTWTTRRLLRGAKGGSGGGPLELGCACADDRGIGGVGGGARWVWFGELR